VGSTIAGVVVALVALTVSLPVAAATVVFFVVFRLLEDSSWCRGSSAEPSTSPHW
jgi:hypothetical protein